MGGCAKKPDILLLGFISVVFCHFQRTFTEYHLVDLDLAFRWDDQRTEGYPYLKHKFIYLKEFFRQFVFNFESTLLEKYVEHGLGPNLVL